MDWCGSCSADYAFDNTKQNIASGKHAVQYVFIIGSKSIGQYGGYETFVDRLIGEHEKDGLSSTMSPVRPTAMDT